VKGEPDAGIYSCHSDIPRFSSLKAALLGWREEQLACGGTFKLRWWAIEHACGS
jgi:hypothetical protein